MTSELTSDPDYFWQQKSLKQLSEEEWESLCDGCGKCCLHKLEDEDTGEILYTNVACRLLDLQTIRCSNYENRRRYVMNCVRLSPDLQRTLRWMPSTCAYRVLAEGGDLPDWHPLITGDQASTVESGHSVKGLVADEREAGPFEDHIVEWPQ